jgi:uncharacterized protein YchJ
MLVGVIMSKAIVMTNCINSQINDNVIVGFDVGIEATNCHNTTINRNYINVNSSQISQTSELRTRKTGRNEKCPCGSGQKFKKCHGGI